MGVAQPFVVVRHGEVVSIAPVARARPAAIARLVRLAHAELAQRGERCAVGISTLCAGLGEVARGYQEARYALESVSPEAGARVLLDLRVSDYLVERADDGRIRDPLAAVEPGRRVQEHAWVGAAEVGDPPVRDQARIRANGCFAGFIASAG